MRSVVVIVRAMLPDLHRIACYLPGLHRYLCSRRCSQNTPQVRGSVATAGQCLSMPNKRSLSRYYILSLQGRGVTCRYPVCEPDHIKEGAANVDLTYRLPIKFNKNNQVEILKPAFRSGFGIAFPQPNCLDLVLIKGIPPVLPCRAFVVLQRRAKSVKVRFAVSGSS